MKAEDSKIQIPTDRAVNLQDVERVMTEMTWPLCTSRKNVTPDDKDALEAMCLGVINPYFSGPTVSKNTRTWTKLTELIARFGQEIFAFDPNFQYSSIQCNKNNHGPSWIIAFGRFKKGLLWVYSEKGGPVEMIVKEKLQGYPFQPGDKIYGDLYDINGKWFQLNGQIPHAALGYEGDMRISLVFFSRKRCETINEVDRSHLQALGLPLPTEEWLSQNAPQQQQQNPDTAVAELTSASSPAGLPHSQEAGPRPRSSRPRSGGGRRRFGR